MANFPPERQHLSAYQPSVTSMTDLSWLLTFVDGIRYYCQETTTLYCQAERISNSVCVCVCVCVCS
jgi:hypothetical protein